MSEPRPRRIVPLLALACLVIGHGCGASAPSVSEAAKPLRIASLTLATDEILSELAPPERVVAVTALADDPGVSNVAGLYPKDLPRIHDANPEPIIALAPDLLCVAPYNSADSLELLTRSGLSIDRYESASSLNEIEAGVLRLAARIGESERGRTLVERMRRRRGRIAEQLQNVSRRPRVLFWSAGFTAGRNTTIDDMIHEGGGVNVALELNLEGSAEIAPERVAALDPDVVLVAYWKADESQAQIATHPILRQLRAVRENRVIAIESRYLTSISQFAVDGLERVARALHPDEFPGGVDP